MKNVKLIVTDMDGCFLHNDKSLPTRTFDMINKCIEKNIKFCVASGRSYIGLSNIFSEVKDDICFVCENGAYVKDGLNEIYQSPLNFEVVSRIVNEILQLNGADCVLCSKKATYMMNKELIQESNLLEAKLYYDNIIFVDDLTNVDDDILKICVCNTNGTEKNTYPFVKHFSNEVEVVVSAFAWIDFFNEGNNKGTGVNKIQEKYGISTEETICFGDYLNDLEMFQFNPYSIAVKNAHETIKSLAYKVIGSNEDEAVVDEIYTILDK